MDPIAAGHLAVMDSLAVRRRGGALERLEDIYAAPDPFLNEDGFLRFRHLDLGRFSEFELWQEQAQCRHRIERDGALPEWFRERYQAIKDELARRAI